MQIVMIISKRNCNKENIVDEYAKSSVGRKGEKYDANIDA